VTRVVVQSTLHDGVLFEVAVLRIDSLTKEALQRLCSNLSMVCGN